MEEQNKLLPGWKLEDDTLSFKVHDALLTIQAATLSEARLAVMEFQDLMEDQGHATIVAANPDKTDMERKGYLVEIRRAGETITVQMLIGYPDEGTEPDLYWLGTTMWPGQALLEFYPTGTSQDKLVPEGFTVEDRRIP